MNHWRIALRSFRDLCAFVGLIVLVSYFYNWTVDIRHWYVTLASAFVCSGLVLGFYVLEAHRDAVTRVSLTFARVALRWLAPLRTRPWLIQLRRLFRFAGLEQLHSKSQETVPMAGSHRRFGPSIISRPKQPPQL
jgi:nuclear transport factor 2 (NTF2) superfamily protein